MKIRFLTVGKCKEPYYRDAASEYLKRLSRFAEVTVQEVQDEKTTDGASETENERVKALEGARLLKLVRDRDYVVALAINGKTFDSEGMAERLQNLMTEGKSDLVFVIGGSLGLSKEVLLRADEKWSYSRLTFPHMLMRVIALEQLYRSFKILAGEPYHK
ncbi:MAG: 23S rRNA (pseudouridine(1915)-N(3))-methyltransferase RlmH [Lachnospiraceae bacterium]|nr:23S rRNA (pseudouridine(1915)-N(3))-methyltransferase RlmH [Lachnospiraceae bacterium]